MLKLIKQYLELDHELFFGKSSWNDLLRLRLVNKKWKQELESLCENYFFDNKFPILGSRIYLTNIIDVGNCEHCGKITNYCQISPSYCGDMGATIFLQDRIPPQINY